MLYNMLRSLLSGNSVSMTSLLAEVAASLLVIFLILPFHELAHGWAAYRLGDPTAKQAGRLTLNPLASVDMMGTLMLLLFGFGWAKPVPFDPRYFKNPKRDTALTALAGPLANLLASLVCGVLYNIVVVAAGVAGVANTAVQFILLFFSACTTINISLAAFNLLPIPPLDGSRIIGMFLSDRAMMVYYRYENIIMYGIFALLLVGVLDVPLAFLQNVFTAGVMFLADLPFRLLGL